MIDEIIEYDSDFDYEGYKDWLIENEIDDELKTRY